jgi:hypothetical protein
MVQPNGSCAASASDVAEALQSLLVLCCKQHHFNCFNYWKWTKTAGTSGTWSIVSGSGTINGNIYTPDNINTNVGSVIKYTIAADGIAATSDDVTLLL